MMNTEQNQILSLCIPPIAYNNWFDYISSLCGSTVLFHSYYFLTDKADYGIQQFKTPQKQIQIAEISPNKNTWGFD